MSTHTFELDSSALLYLASRTRSYTNAFRISVTLTEPVLPQLLQLAVGRVAPRFPMIAAGIRKGVRQYEVVPAQVPPRIQPDRERLAGMTEEMVRNCAMRVLYRGRKLSVEIFHTLTDGYGRLVFLQSLAAEYISLSHGMPVRGVRFCHTVRELSADDYRIYAGKNPISFRRRQVFQFPNRAQDGSDIHTVTGICPLSSMIELSHRMNVSLTSLLTAVMASCSAEIQARYCYRRQWRPIQILVPANLRKRFPSDTLRNFTLYALPCVEKAQLWLPVAALAAVVDRQIKEQLTEEHLAGMMSTQVKLQTMPLAAHTPLPLKMGALRLGNLFFGDKNSCLTLSNLGEVTFPEELSPFVERVEFLLTPRKNTPYNCGVSSYSGKLYINFTHRGIFPELEKLFFQRLAQMGFPISIEVDGLPIHKKSWEELSHFSALPKENDESLQDFNETQTKQQQFANNGAV